VFYLLIKLVVFLDRLLAYSRHSSLSDFQVPERKKKRKKYIMMMLEKSFHYRSIKTSNSLKLNYKREQGMSSILRRDFLTINCSWWRWRQFQSRYTVVKPFKILVAVPHHFWQTCRINARHKLEAPSL